MLKMEQVSARYETVSGYVNSVDNVSFEVRKNEIMGIAGESGCGKSTLLKTMYDLVGFPLEICGGKVSLVTESSKEKRVLTTGEIRDEWWKEISYVPQGAMHVMNPVKRVREQFFDVIPKEKRQKKAEQEKSITAYLKELELPPEVLDAYPHQLSGGMRQRVIIALATIIPGGIVLFATLAAISLIGMQELYKAMRVHENQAGSLEIMGYAGAMVYYLTLLLDREEFSLIAILFALVLIMSVYVFTYPKYHADQIMAAMFGVIYVAVMLSYIYKTRNLEGGAWLVGLIFISSWGSDTCAYCVGMLIGKHKMAPVLSPKKSVEGGVGGVVGAALLGALYAVVIAKWNPASGHTALMYALICAVGALISMVGDLAASAIKRNKEIKDYGRLIPGHGGILDRFDSVIFTAPFIYFLANVLL